MKLIASIVGTLCCLFASQAMAAERGCAFREGPGIDGNMFEPPLWPSTLATLYTKPGIVRGSHHHFYLYAAWRSLAGMPLPVSAQQRLAPFEPCSYVDAGPALAETQALWLAQRSLALGGAAPGVQLESYSSAHNGLNCNPDAYRSAAHTLASRQASHGRGPALADWVAAQDLVFAACARRWNTGEVALPPDAIADAAPWLQYDRAYQQAAALMYTQRHGEAAARFDAIAATPASPWQGRAAYMAARAELRAGTKEEAPFAADALKRAEARLLAIAAGSPDSTLRHDAGRLLQFAALRLRPRDMLAELDTRLSASALSETIGQDIDDYGYLWRSGVDAPPGLQYGDWLAAMRGKGGGAGDAAQRWHSTRALPWLVAALAHSQSDAVWTDGLLADARNVASDSPAYPSVRFHLARLAGGAQARALAGAALSAESMPEEDRNALRRAGLLHAASLADVARFAPRTNALASLRYSHFPSVDRDGALMINTALTLDQMVALAGMPAVPPALGGEIRSAAFVRALVLERFDVMRALVPHIRSSCPSAAALAGALRSARDPRRQRALGAMLLARHPGLVAHVRSAILVTGAVDPQAIQQPHMQARTDREEARENWWCSFAGSSAATPGFLDQRERAVLEQERRVLAAAANGPDYLAPIVMAHARRHPRDAQLAPALATLIRGSGGCTAGHLNGEMFRHLQRFFPASAWLRAIPRHKMRTADEVK